MPESGTPAAALLAICTPWLAQFGAIAWADLTITRPDGRRCTLSVPITALEPTPPPQPPALEPPPPASPVPAPDLRPRHRRLLAAATREPSKKPALINRAGLPYNGDACRCLRRLIVLGLIAEDADGCVHLPA